MLTSFQTRSELSVALRPRTGSVWLLGLHQCTYDRDWDDADQRLLTDIGRRLADVLGMHLLHRQLEENRFELALAVDIAGIGRWWFDFDEGKFHFSDRGFTLFGLAHRDQSVSYQELEEALGDAARALHPDRLRGWFAQGEQVDFLCSLMWEGELQRILRVHAQRQPENDGRNFELNRIAGTMQDVTELQRRQRELETLRDRLQDAQELANTGSWELNCATKEVWWSDEVFRIFGYEPRTGSPAPLDAESRIHPDDLAELRRRLSRTEQAGESFEMEYRVTKPDGEQKTVLSRGRMHHGKRDVIAGVLIDLTEQRRKDREVLRLKERLAEAQNISGIGSWEWDLVQDTVWWSEQMYEIWMVDPKTFDPGFENIVKYVHPDDVQGLKTTVAFTLETGKPYTREYRILRGDGEVRWVYARGQMLYDAEHSPSSFMGTVQDITDQRQLDAKVQQAQKPESLGVLAGGIAHDFNNLLVGILGNASLSLQTISKDSRAWQQVRLIEEAARKAADLTRQMLAYSGKGSFVTELINLSEHVEELTDLLRVSIAKNATLKFSLTPDLPKVECDVAQITQVVMNLIINASDAIGEANGVIHVSTGEVRVTKEYLANTLIDEDLPAGKYIYLEVSDNGCGMDEKTCRKIFDPFFTTKFTGRGLGLAAVMGIVRGHRGAIKVYSELGKGTSMKMLLPNAENTVITTVRQAEEVVSDEPKALKGCVLIVDDEETVRQVTEMMVESFGMDSILAEDGQDAVEIFEKRQDEIDLVLLDMTMPRMNGEQAFAALRQINPDVRVLLTSGYNEQDATDRFNGKGLAGFVQKPFDLSVLRDAIQRVLESDR